MPATGPPPRHEGEGLSAARSLVELSLTGQAAWRRFAYANGITGAARVQTNVPFPGVALAGAVFPLAWTGTAWGDFGLTAEYDRLFLPTNTVNGFASDLSPTSYAAGLRARVHPGRNPRVVVVASASYAVTTFGPVGPETSDLPQVIYRALRPGLDLRVQLGVVSLTAAAGFRWIVDPSAISTRFYAPRGYGADGEVGAGVVVASRLILTLSLGYERYAFDFTAPSETALGAGGALDQILRAGLAATALF